jgi:DNA repair protein RecO (recombination protein O)
VSEITVQAVVLRRRDAGETDRRLTLLTPELGKIDVFAKGARKGGSRLAGVSDPLSVAKLAIAQSKRNRYVTQAQPQSSFPGLRTDFDRLSMALAVVELFAAVIPYEEPDPEAYELLIRVLQSLEKHPRPLAASAWAQVALMSHTGFLPVFMSCVVTESPLREGEPFLSPRAGGYVSDAASAPFSDRFRVRAEVVINLDRLAPLENPPPNLKFVEETLGALFPFWRHIADTALPANEAFVHGLRVGQL